MAEPFLTDEEINAEVDRFAWFMDSIDCPAEFEELCTLMEEST